jgi:DNA-directed RNA polymerase subunit RPC12/RpoP
MSEFKTFFRRCPNCGRRFEIHLLTKKLVGEKIIATNYERPSSFVSPRYGAPLVVEENVPLSVDEQEFQYSYRCKHCGHQWIEFVDNERGKVSGD